MTLLDQHQKLLDASAISPEVAEARGYFSATKRTELADLGFARYQQIVPALVLPSYGVDGAIVNYQARPDRPRIDPERGREVKYETIAGSVMRLDVPPPARPHLGSTRRALWITEGIRKGDALASRDLPVVVLLGVWSFAVREDWERIALDGRHVYVVYDNDVMHKREVHDALARLARVVTQFGATPHFVYLPEDEGKIGVDDYLAAGHTLDDLYALAEDELREPPELKQTRPPARPTMWLLHSVERYLRRFVRFPDEHAITALTLFVAHTWAFEAAQATPYLLILSPEMRAGKTRALETVELVVRESLRAVDITAAGIFQAIEAWRPTLLIDEIDALWKARSDQAEAVRSVLNSGNRRGAVVVRGTPEGEPVKFSTWAPKMLAGISNGHLPDTIRDRSIVLKIERLRTDEHVDDLFPVDLAEPMAELRDLLENWAAQTIETLAAWRRSERVPGVDARLQEAWDPLLAIADDAGGNWPARAKDAAMALAKDRGDDAQTDGHLLLVALRTMFDGKDGPLASKAICRALNDNETLPFADYGKRGDGIAPNALAQLLRPYGVRPRTVRIGAETAKGYQRDQFVEAWQRYALPTEGATEPSQPSQPSQPSHPSPHGKGDVTDVTDVTANSGPPRDASSNGRVAAEDAADYAERFRQRQAEGEWGAKG